MKIMGSPEKGGYIRHPSPVCSLAVMRELQNDTPGNTRTIGDADRAEEDDGGVVRSLATPDRLVRRPAVSRALSPDRQRESIPGPPLLRQARGSQGRPERQNPMSAHFVALSTPLAESLSA